MARFYCCIIILTICLAGCVKPNFTRLDSIYRGPKGEFTVNIPNNWMRYLPVKDSCLTITHDGLELQEISISMMSITSSLAHTHRKLNAGMMAQELAELFIDDLKSDVELMNLQISDNNPVTICGRDGFRFTYTYKTKDDLRKKGMMYGFLKNSLAFTLDYRAAAQVYFEKDIATFENIIVSFQVK